MTGFFAFRANILEKITFGSYGFKILVELLVREEGLRVQDIPFTFMSRENEESKASAGQGLRFISDIATIFRKTSFGNPLLKHFFLVLFLTALTAAAHYLEVFFGAKNSGFFAFEGILLVLFLTFILSITASDWIFSNSQKKKNMTPLSLSIVWSVLVAFSIFWMQQHFFQGTMMQYIVSVFVGGLVSFLLVRPFVVSGFRNANRYFLVLLGIFVSLAVVTDFVSVKDTGYFILVLAYSFIILQGLFALYLMIFSWMDAEGEDGAVHTSPKQYVTPEFSFTAIVPCKHERYAIADTLKTLSSMSYPEHMFEVIVVIHEGTDDGTIGIVRETIDTIGKSNLRLVTYDVAPVNKPHGLNHALKESRGDVVVIFDAEDEPHTELFHIINTEMIQRNLDVVQSGVQLMNYDYRWYSLFNVLEYYFWFKSSLHYFANQGVTTLGGVTVFFKRSWLNHVGGWDNSCLTEDADVGIRLSQAGARIGVVYDAEHATQEETPPSLWSFVKQRTRWAQGFLQIISRGVWLRFPTLRQKLLALYVLSWPFTLLVLFMVLPFGIATMFMVDLPPTVAVLSNIPLILFLIFVVVQLLGLYEFTQEYNKPFPWLRIPFIVLSFYPYTILLAFAGIRAMYRNLKNNTSWEKTEHLNNHRVDAGSGVDVLARETQTAQ